MTTHLRARAVQAGALLALVGGILVVAPPAAFADTVVGITVSPADLQSGGTTTVKYTVTNNNPTSGRATITFSAGGMTCKPTTDCNPGDVDLGTDANNKSRQFSATLTAPTVDPGPPTTFQIRITAQINGQTGQATQDVKVSGQDKAQTVRQVNGRVKDADGKSISGANVGVRDSQGHQYQATSNDEGRFSFTSSDSAPILPGNLFVGAVKDKYSPVTVQVQGSANKVLTVPLTMKLIESAATATPSPSVTANTPTNDAVTDPATEAAPAPAAGTKNASQNTGNGSSKLYIILGALLVAAGLGAILLLVMRRRTKGDDLDDPDGGGGPSGPVPLSQGRFNGVPDATRVAAPVGGRMNETMLAGRSGPSISDAPTMLQQAVQLDDEFPDPYGVPAAPHGGYAGAGGYGTTAAGAYGAGGYGGAQVPAQSGGYDPGPPTQFGAPAPQDEDPYAAYGAPQNGAGGYDGAGAQPRYDEPTGMYRPEPAGGAYARGGQEQGYQAGNYGGEYAPEPEYPPVGGGRGPGETSGAYRAGGYQGGGYSGGQEQQWDAPAEDGGNAYGAPAGGNYGPAASPYGGGRPAPGTYGGGGDYGAPAGGRGRSAGDYGDQDAYDPRSTYGRPEQPPVSGGYGGPPPAAGGYGGPPPAAGGYGGDDGYAHEPYGGGGQGGHYGADQGGRRHGGQPQPLPPPESSRPGQRRGLDWLDD